jgi:hypothetical protein
MGKFIVPKGSPADVRFWASVPRKGLGCWLWEGPRPGGGYGHFKLNRRTVHPSKAAYVLCVGPVPDGMCVCHRCDTPACVRPDHLFLGTHQDNMDDMVAKCRHLRNRPKHHKGKVSPEQRTEIRRRRPTESLSKLALEFGVSRTAIIKICREVPAPVRRRRS